ncbi:hypothetical protein CFP71_10035 [Amycolatopsis thailandensis]|uniref:Uncharacterized protein n=1 Tax=Amycolatopsis thailandensis TaxID=589330 RepID=A0A229SDZ1_9PSEU|nr:hypothetical protein [Amycolatopsis thailandensis]OXM57065.1 hypothetical protein CFP71_10035 [Amycolatopsis thailandensis]
MAVIHDDLNIQTTPCRTPAHGLTYRGALRASYRTLTTRFGAPDFGTSGSPDGEATLWVIDTPGGRVQLQNWLAVEQLRRRPDEDIRWSVQAATDHPLPWTFKAATGSTAQFPAAVGEFTRQSSSESLTEAYVDYLYQRGQAFGNWVNLQRRDSRGYLENWTLPRHLHGFALQVLEILHDHQWAQASYDERLGWICTGAPQEPAGSDVDRWRRQARWRYVPDPNDPPTGSEVLDLAGALRERAADCAWAKDHLVRPGSTGITRTRKIALYEEHVATLTALADAKPAATTGAGR